MQSGVEWEDVDVSWYGLFTGLPASVDLSFAGQKNEHITFLLANCATDSGGDPLVEVFGTGRKWFLDVSDLDGYVLPSAVSRTPPI